jgi:hypothetical protein
LAELRGWVRHRRWWRSLLVTVVILSLLAMAEFLAWRVEERASITLAFEPVGLKYTLRPGGEINTQGFRQANALPARTPGLKRVVVLGDSVTYGLLLPYGDAWPHRMALELNHADVALAGRLARRRAAVEVYDFAVPGYDQEQIAVLAEQVLAEWRPDVLVYGYFWNDPSETLVTRMAGYPTWVASHDPPFTFFGRAFDTFLHRRSAAFRRVQGAVAAHHYPDKEESLDWDFFEIHAQRLVGAARAANVPLVVLTIPAHILSEPADKCDERAMQWPGFCKQSEDSVTRANAWFRAQGARVVEGLAAYRADPQMSFMQSPGNPSHPSTLGQVRLAGAVLPEVRAALGIE